MEATDTKIRVTGMDLFHEATPREAEWQAVPRPRGDQSGRPGDPEGST